MSKSLKRKPKQVKKQLKPKIVKPAKKEKKK
jgi:hypothetical protein